MSELESVTQWATDIISENLYLGIFLASLVETVFPPIPTLAIFPVAGYIASQSGMGPPEVILLGIIGGIGASIGSSVIYAIAYKLGRVVLLRYLHRVRISEEKLRRVEEWFGRHGDKTVFLGRLVPGVREMVSVPAGLLKMQVYKFALYTFLGSCAYSCATIFAGYYFGVGVFGTSQEFNL